MNEFIINEFILFKLCSNEIFQIKKICSTWTSRLCIEVVVQKKVIGDFME